MQTTLKQLEDATDSALDLLSRFEALETENAPLFKVFESEGTAKLKALHSKRKKAMTYDSDELSPLVAKLVSVVTQVEKAVELVRAYKGACRSWKHEELEAAIADGKSHVGVPPFICARVEDSSVMCNSRCKGGRSRLNGDDIMK